jgi:hypothetical protein
VFHHLANPVADEQRRLYLDILRRSHPGCIEMDSLTRNPDPFRYSNSTSRLDPP